MPAVGRTRRQFLAGGAAAAGMAYASACTSRRGRTREPPNVLVIIVDTLRADHSYGARAQTPNFDALAARGLSFTRCFPEAMPTVPARNSILSGRRMFPFRDWKDHQGLLAKPGWAPLEDVKDSFPSVLRQAGWWTGYVTDNPFLGFSAPYEALRSSLDLFTRHGGQIGGRDGPVPADTLKHWLHPAVREAGMTERIRRYIANADYSENERRSFAAQVFNSGVDALDQASANRPFALIVDAYEPHEPWTPPRRYTDPMSDGEYRGPEPAMPRYGRVENWLGEEDRGLVLERLRIVYAAEVGMTDHWLGKLLERLRGLGLERDTIIVFVSDHGVQLGERGWLGKISTALHPELIQVPLVIVDPAGRSAGRKSGYYASTHDLAPTILSMTGVRPPPGMDGIDLSSLFGGVSPPERGFAYGGWSNNHYLRDGSWAYMSDNALREPRLFDLEADHWETRNVARRHPGVVAELARVVEARAGGRLPVYPS
jgi:arylsulfatase A-like enzyme